MNTAGVPCAIAVQFVALAEQLTEQELEQARNRGERDFTSKYYTEDDSRG